MCGTQLFPLLSFAGKRIGFEDGQGHKGRSDAEDDVVPDVEPPKWRDSDLVEAAPTFNSHATAAAKEADFAEFMIPDDEPQFRAEFIAQLAQTLLDALEGGFVAESERGAV